MGRTLLYIIIFGFLLFACRKEEEPDILPPLLMLSDAKAITRTTAEISAEITLCGRGTVSAGRFKYATTRSFSDALQMEINSTKGRIEAFLSDLKAGTVYYYMLEVTNGYSTVQSAIGQFQTDPNTAPLMGAIELIHKGPFSAAVQCRLNDNGGESLTAQGFLIRSIAEQKEQFIAAEQVNDTIFRAKLPDLDLETLYTVRAYATNLMGETFGEPLEFQTDNAIYTTIPGSLPEIIGERQKYLLTAMSVAGKLNGTDLRLLREMLGRDVDGNSTPGKLRSLDLSDASLVDGGASYFGSRYSRPDTLGYGTFATSNLQDIRLPQSLKVIEKDAFLDCGDLTTIHIPENVTEYTPSDGCSQLATLSVSPFNPHFSDKEGVLFDKPQTILIQYPEGKKAVTFLIPTTIKTLGDNAFLRAPLDMLVLPASVSKLGAQVFRYAKLQSVILSDAIATIPNGTFQGCSSLQSITLGSNTDLISNYCFDQCIGLQTLYVKACLPPVCYAQTFSGADIFNQCILYIPSGSRNTYRQNKHWKNFIQIKEQKFTP